jgi:hypothetical protein
LDRLGAVTDKAPALQLEHAQRTHELGLLRWPELVALGQHDVRDRQRVAGVGLARSAAVALAMGAPRRDLRHLKPGAGQSSNQAASIAAGALHADHRAGGGMLDQPADQLPIARRAVRDREGSDLAAAVIDQRGGMSLLVNVDADDQGGLLARG